MLRIPLENLNIKENLESNKARDYLEFQPPFF